MGQETGENGPPQPLCSRRSFCRAGSSQQVHPGLLQHGPGLHLRQQGAREHHGAGTGVEALDDAQTVGVTVGDEDAEGERGHVKRNLLTQYQSYKSKSIQGSSLNFA